MINLKTVFKKELFFLIGSAIIAYTWLTEKLYIQETQGKINYIELRDNMLHTGIVNVNIVALRRDLQKLIIDSASNPIKFRAANGNNYKNAIEAKLNILYLLQELSEYNPDTAKIEIDAKQWKIKADESYKNENLEALIYLDSSLTVQMNRIAENLQGDKNNMIRAVKQDLEKTTKNNICLYIIGTVLLLSDKLYKYFMGFKKESANT